MKRLCASVVMGVLAIFWVVTVNAAPPTNPDTTQIPQGIKNAKKVMQSRIERDKKMQELQEKAQAEKTEAQSVKDPTPPQ